MGPPGGPSLVDREECFLMDFRSIVAQFFKGLGGNSCSLGRHETAVDNLDGSAKQVMLATQFHATVDPKWLPIQRRSTASYGRKRCLPRVSIEPIQEEWPYAHRQTESSMQK